MIQYRFLHPGEEQAACALVEFVFNEFVAPDLGPEGVQEFFRFANPIAMAARSGPEQIVVVAEHNSSLVGMIELRNGNHVSLLFVSLRGQSIARELLLRAAKECQLRQPDITKLTVNSSLYAEPMYRRLGFQPTSEPQTINGIRHIPMLLVLHA